MGHRSDLDHCIRGGPGKNSGPAAVPPQQPARRTSTVAIELAFLGHAFERFGGALDAVLVVVAVGWKQLHDSISAVAGHVADRPRREEDGLTDLELVLFQR